MISDKMKKRSYSIIVLLLIIGLFHNSCNRKDDKREQAIKVVKEWTGKEILFPEEFQCNFLRNDTFPELCEKLFESKYKVLLYTDSLGCTSCKLNLPVWKQMVEEADSLFSDQLNFLLFFHPKDVKELQLSLRQNRFEYPVFFDLENKIEELNHFPDEQSYQCFLLDQNNKVILIGNPALNPAIWQLYKEQISGKKEEKNATTSIEINPTSYNYEEISMNKSSIATFKIKNTGENPLLIHRISTSCGCTSVKWDKQPCESDMETEIKVEMKPEEKGYFHKQIDVYCNVNKSPVILTISGTAIE